MGHRPDVPDGRRLHRDVPGRGGRNHVPQLSRADLRGGRPGDRLRRWVGGLFLAGIIFLVMMMVAMPFWKNPELDETTEGPGPLDHHDGPSAPPGRSPPSPPASARGSPCASPRSS